ncbi:MULTISPECIES: hypothetical protein [Aeromicrobium]|uniref:hypothetical protein n=1 Tax=Aeromicrobium TaxID=2040 RepID=UPI00257AE288|nr:MULTISPECIES: hypothetical protein [Aeromicrobium]
MLPVLTTKPDQQWTDLAVSRDAALRRRAPELPDYRVAPWSPEPLLVLDKQSPWIVMPYDKDPLRARDGGYPFPRDVKRRLQDFATRGVDFDSLAIAHELDPKGAVAPLLEKIPPTGLVCDASTTATLVGETPATGASKRMATTLNRAGDAIAESGPKVLLGLALAPVAIVAAPLALAAAAVEGIDPIVFGVLHVDPAGSLGTARPTRLQARRAGACPSSPQASLWYPLAAWKW